MTWAERSARITALAEHVLEDHEAAEQFLTSPHPLLGGTFPDAARRLSVGGGVHR